ncbi:hypothetical protein E2C01_092986 [Portunus trituberculatus]|jgi:hypothetical protein
MLSQ